MKIILTILALLPVASYSQVCEPTPAGQSAIQAMGLIYQPSKMIGSCATTQPDGPTNWRGSLDTQVSEYLAQDHSEKLDPTLDHNNMTNPNVVMTQTDGYLKASNAYRDLIASYPDKKGMNANQFTDIDRILKAKDISGKERSRAYAALDGHLKEMIREQDRWSGYYSEQTAELMKSPELHKRVVDQAKKKFCVSGVSFDVVPASGMTTELLKDSGSQISAANKKVQDRIQVAESNPNQVWFCSKPIPMQSALYEASGLISYDLPEDSFFEDNQSTLSQKKIEAFKSKLKEQLRTPPGCERTVKSVQIETSSNAKANSEQIGRWNFAKLSADRASYVQKLTNEIFKEEKGSKNFVHAENLEAITRISSSGSNGDGTSGPCPYKVVQLPSGVRSIIEDKAVWNSEAMKTAKFSRVSFEIQDKGISCNHGPDYKQFNSQPYVASQCFTVTISCR